MEEAGEKAPEGTAVAGGEDGGGFYNRRLHNFPLIKVSMGQNY